MTYRQFYTVLYTLVERRMVVPNGWHALLSPVRLGFSRVGPRPRTSDKAKQRKLLQRERHARMPKSQLGCSSRALLRPEASAILGESPLQVCAG